MFFRSSLRSFDLCVNDNSLIVWNLGTLSFSFGVTFLGVSILVHFRKGFQSFECDGYGSKNRFGSVFKPPFSKCKSFYVTIIGIFIVDEGLLGIRYFEWENVSRPFNRIAPHKWCSR